MILIRFNLIEYGEVAMKSYHIIYNWLDFIAISPYSIKLEMILIRSNLIEYGKITLKSYDIIYD